MNTWAYILGNELYDRLKKYTSRNRMSIATFVRMAVVECLDSKERK